ncbi:hypothetical protein O9G_003969 [Rozella allomycis CSF55]|uniref:MYND-type domain-containing protein n=1 Tax=Rozella allomycis (strain CSF55) TaxID=988480 RepID=A0A075AU82_ROZAC|nr:hypothetical protein O9G_003969 [Rozella allomycis CSF55]|eukprot:EPZ33861.1 hypothetical protein O9G_003969 [Rozella allomycis CSF55]
MGQLYKATDVAIDTFKILRETDPERLPLAKKAAELNRKTGVLDKKSQWFLDWCASGYDAFCLFCKVGKPSKDLLKCEKCKVAHYCNEEHQEEDYHEFVCEELASSVIYPDLASTCQLLSKSLKPRKIPLDVNNWDDFMKRIGLNPNVLFQESLAELATMVRVLRKLHLDKKPKINIHIIGVEEHREILQIPLFLHLPVLIGCSIKITMVGPMLHSSRTVQGIECVKLPYHMYVESSKYTKPDAIIAFHPGFHDISYTTWSETLVDILTSEIPLIMTSFSKHDLDSSNRVMESPFIQANLVESFVNPFAAAPYLFPDLTVLRRDWFVNIYKGSRMPIGVIHYTKAKEWNTIFDSLQMIQLVYPPETRQLMLLAALWADHDLFFNKDLDLAIQLLENYGVIERWKMQLQQKQSEMSE